MQHKLQANFDQIPTPKSQYYTNQKREDNPDSYTYCQLHVPISNSMQWKHHRRIGQWIVSTDLFEYVETLIMSFLSGSKKKINNKN